jgi:hypothetical protein
VTIVSFQNKVEIVFRNMYYLAVLENQGGNFDLRYSPEEFAYCMESRTATLRLATATSRGEVSYTPDPSHVETTLQNKV